ncbi:ABC transporter ATP-binding protein [Roseibium algae]|uniref:ABC transporter ATP-binding protein n=1 Tax=Roseibium algae TaxID=3123038 RepID=A0ABU8TFQ5_9HYPH
MPDTLARLNGLTVKYDSSIALEEICLDLPDAKIIAFCGPNGSGKSTALRVMRGLHQPAAGDVEIAGKPVADWNARELARKVAMLSQSPNAPSDLTVAELVRLGRFAHRGPFSVFSKKDEQACHTALEATEMLQLQDRALAQLSGGQVQRAWIAMTLAQDAARIFLDEPTNHLDIAHAFELLDLISRLKTERKRSFVLVLHDLNMAMRYADHVVLFKNGKVAADGPTIDVLSEQNISQVFGVRCKIMAVSELEKPVIVSWGEAKRN